MEHVIINKYDKKSDGIRDICSENHNLREGYHDNSRAL